MAAQSFVAAFLVTVCSAYVVWALMPAGARRAVASRVLKWSLPESIQRLFQRAMNHAGACGGCDNCGDGKPTVKSAVQPIRIHRGTKR